MLWPVTFKGTSRKPVKFHLFIRPTDGCLGLVPYNAEWLCYNLGTSAEESYVK